MALSKRQLKAIELLFEGRFKDYEIAKEVKVTPQTLVNWKKNPEFVDALRQMGVNYMHTTMISPLIKNQFKLAMTAKSEQVRQNATKDLLDRIGIGNEQHLKVDMQASVTQNTPDPFDGLSVEELRKLISDG
ncbi:TPA: hypothetical protein U0601_002228 [Streptococcus suis]|nr:hypothetical protein [Streptococcus suis]HEM5056646.1 hypothetical protein [Streptococcus suis]